MLTACWSVKGGSGTTVVSAALGLVVARAGHDHATLLDLAGEVPAALGIPDPSGPGLTEWLATEARAPASFARLIAPAAGGLGVVPRGAPLPPDEDDSSALFAAMADVGGAWVVDAGVPAGPLAREVVTSADTSLLVLRPCYLALRRALATDLPAHGVVLVREPGRVLTAKDIEDVLRLPVRAEIDVDPAVARAVDAGLLAGRLPRLLERSLRGAA